MTATIELPDNLYEHVGAAAARRGLAMDEFIAEVLAESIRASFADDANGRDHSAKSLFGGLSHLHEENLQIQQMIDEACEVIETQDSH